MKTLIIYTVLIIVCTGNCMALNSQDSIFALGNGYFKEGNYVEANNCYSKILSMGYKSAELYYNIGNTYFKLREYPQAILYYERALVLDPGNEDISYNLTLTRSYIQDKIDEIPEFVILRWLNNFISILSTNQWAIISIVTFILALSCLAIYFLSFRSKLKRWGFYAAGILLMVSIVAFASANRSKNLMLNNKTGIVISPTITIKSSPRENGKDLFIIHEGTKVFILGKLDEWYEIKLPDGKQGWLMKSDIEPVQK